MTDDPVDDYYKPLTSDERAAGIRGKFPAWGYMLEYIRRWEATVRQLEGPQLMDDDHRSCREPLCAELAGIADALVEELAAADKAAIDRAVWKAFALGAAQ